MRCSKLNVLLAFLGLVFLSHTEAATFTDVANTAGVQNTLSSFGVCFTDYDGDGEIDLYVVNDSEDGVENNELYRNNGNGTFTAKAADLGVKGPAAGQGCGFADYDNDGDPDLYVTSLGFGSRLYKNNGNATFTDVTAAAGVDGFFRGNNAVAWGDYDEDGCLDMYIGHRYKLSPETNQQSILYRSNCDGTFTDVAPALGLDLPNRKNFGGWWFDYDKDEDIDLIVALDFFGSLLFRNNGDGTFTDVTAAAFPLLTAEGGAWPRNPMGAAIGDYDNDGDYDLFITGTDKQVRGGEKPSRLWQNDGDGTFTEVTLAAGIPERTVTDWATEFIDYDNDGFLDLYVVAGAILSPGHPNALYRNDGDGTFTDVTAATGTTDNGATMGSAWADYDGDGDYDWYVPNTQNQANRLFQNQGPVGNSLRIKTVGTATNSDGIGAKVRVTAGGVTQLRERYTHGGFLSQSAPEAHFGLGTLTTVDQIEVSWPSGVVDTLTNVAANQTLTVAEGCCSGNEPVTIDTSSLPDGQVGVAYSATLQASLGTPPYTWSISAGSLPAGLTLAGNSGEISGTPTTEGLSAFTVMVADANSSSDTKELSINVTAAALGSVSGTVTDRTGAIVSGATVDLFSLPSLAKLATTTTDALGKYTLGDLGAGSYRIEGRKQGLGRARKDITLAAGETLQVDLALK